MYNEQTSPDESGSSNSNEIRDGSSNSYEIEESSSNNNVIRDDLQLNDRAGGSALNINMLGQLQSMYWPSMGDDVRSRLSRVEEHMLTYALSLAVRD